MFAMSQASFYGENGYLLVRGLFDGAEVDELRAAVERVLERVAGGEHDHNHAWPGVESGTVLRGFHELQYHDAAFSHAVGHPPLVEVLTRMVGPNVQLHHTKMMV